MAAAPVISCISLLAVLSTCESNCPASAEPNFPPPNDLSAMIQSNVNVYLPSPLSKENSASMNHPHKRIGGTNVNQTNVDSDGGGTLPVHDEHHEGHGYLALVFLCGCLIIGSFILVLQERILQAVPYTCLLFLAGLLMAIVHHYKPKDSWMTWNAWFASVDTWQAINPHLIFYIFLPVLIFGDGFKLDVHLVRNMLWQVLLLAGPGVVFGVVFTGVFTHWLLPYGWSWSTCFLFGSILSATDPVAVVSLFNSLGVSAELTMLVSGESLLNDGTAIVAFALALKCVHGVYPTLWSGFGFFLNMTVVAYILGFFLAFLAVMAICVCSKSDGHSDPFIQVVITLCVAYACFFFAEYELGTSGVLTLVSASVVMSQTVWPMFISREIIKVVWETIEFIANTVIFMLAGLILGGMVLSSKNYINAADFGYLLIFYVALTLIRTAMLLCFWKPLRMLGSSVDWKDVVVMVWAGLRGAISLTMALIVNTDPTIDRPTGAKVIFYVGGIAALTILINAVTCGPLLTMLGLTDVRDFTKKKIHHYESIMVKHVQEVFLRQQKSEDVRFRGVNADIVKEMLPVLKHSSLGASHAAIGKTQDATPHYREMFLEMVKRCYWEDVETDIIPHNSAVAQKLLDVASQGAFDLDRLPDWDTVQESVSKMTLSRMQFCTDLVRSASLAKFTDLLETFPSRKLVQLQLVYASLCFQEAHRKAAAMMLRQNFSDVSAVTAVLQEANAQRQKASDFLHTLAPADVEIGKAKMMARYLINAQKSEVKTLENQGMLKESEVSHFCHEFHDQRSAILSDRLPSAVMPFLKD